MVLSIYSSVLYSHLQRIDYPKWKIMGKGIVIFHYFNFAKKQYFLFFEPMQNLSRFSVSPYKLDNPEPLEGWKSIECLLFPLRNNNGRFYPLMTMFDYALEICVFYEYDYAIINRL